MPSDLFKRIDLDSIYLPFLERALELVAKCRAKGQVYYAVSGYRSYDEQARKYAIGRGEPGARITNAQPGYSMHQYGTAIDFAQDMDLAKPGLQTNWDTSKGQYDCLRDEAKGMGLQVGVPTVPGGDKGHVQIHVPTVFGGQEMSMLSQCKYQYLKKDKLSDSWAWLDANAKWPLR
jgi:peptidoglycan L-alanyl-D-glutamate endopeptidase CwlK